MGGSYFDYDSKTSAYARVILGVKIRKNIDKTQYFNDKTTTFAHERRFSSKSYVFRRFRILRVMSKNIKENKSDLVALDIISYFSRSLFKNNSPEEIVWDIAEKCIKTLGFNDCVIYLKNDEKKHWQQIAAFGPKKLNNREIIDPINIPYGKGIVGYVGKSGVAEVVYNTKTDDRYITDDEVRSSEMTVPIWCDNEVIGIIDSEHEDFGYYTKKHLRIVQSIANICGQKIGRALSEKRTSSFARFYEENPSPVFRINDSGEVMMLNESTRNVFGESVQVGEIVHIPELVKGLETINQNKKKLQIQISYGKQHYILDVCPNKSRSYYNVYAINVTELMEERNRVKKAESVKSAFLSTMSHEIRTPLNAILGLNYLMLNSDMTKSDLRKHLKSMEFSGKQLQSLVADILDFSRIQEGKVSLRHSVFNLHKLCDLVFNSFYQRAKEHGNFLNIEIEDSTPVWVKGDMGKVIQMLNNLINNSLKFTDQGVVLVYVSMKGDLGLVQFDVIDNGRGISEKNMIKIFDAFEQSDDQEVNVGESGSGLGLPISRNLAELHGGKLSVVSSLNKGSTFTLEVKFEIVKKPKKIKLDKKQNSEAHLLKLPVLIVDDNHINSFVVSELIKQMGYNTVTENDGAQALEVSKKMKPFLIFMDIQMPILDGYKATQMIREYELKMGLNRVPIIALTADAEPSTKEKALDSGMDDVIVKPFSPTQLEIIVGDYASRFRKTQ
jgi:signal transduction histidine kinase/CheY-like chemotaxis protein